MNRPIRGDALPEGFTYKDEGCAESPSCLKCPLAVCVYEYDVISKEKRRHRSLFNAKRDNWIFEQRKKGLRPTEIARAVKISARTVHRVIRRGGAHKQDQAELADLEARLERLQAWDASTIYKTAPLLPRIEANYR